MADYYDPNQVINLFEGDDGELNVIFELSLVESIAGEFAAGVNSAIRRMLGYTGRGSASANADLMKPSINEENGPLHGESYKGEDWYYYSVEYGAEMLHRPSLVPNAYDGLSDVVAAFSVGWNIHAETVPRGLWQSRNVRASALLNRQPNGAIVDFAEAFEDKYPMVRVSLPSEWGRA